MRLTCPTGMTEGEEQSHLTHETFHIPTKGREGREIMATFDDRLDRDIILGFLVTTFHSFYRRRIELTTPPKLQEVSPRKSHGQRRNTREIKDIARQQLHDERSRIEGAIDLFEGKRQGYVRILTDEENKIRGFDIVTDKKERA